MNVDFSKIDPQNELSDLYAPDYRERALNEDAYFDQALDQAYEDRFELACMADFE